jgi:hypothetical protein
LGPGIHSTYELECNLGCGAFFECCLAYRPSDNMYYGPPQRPWSPVSRDTEAGVPL